MPSQQLSLSQSLNQLQILAPQLRQGLEMLQLPILELRSMIQQELEKNPTIEEASSDLGSAELAEGGPTAIDDSPEMDFVDKQFEAIAKLDDEWRDYFYQNNQSHGSSQDAEEKHQFMLDSLTSPPSMQEHLIEQLRMTGLSESDRQLAELLIGSINDDGYLSTSITEIAQSAALDLKHAEDVLAVIQDFHPTGVGARDLRECLLLQLEKMDKGESLAASIVRDHLDDLGRHRMLEIGTALHVDLDEVHEAAKVIASLDPKPGRMFTPDVATYIEPEIVIQKVGDAYVVILNDHDLPHIRISKHYRSLLEDESTSAEVKSYIRERIRAGAFLIKSIHQRQDTLRKISNEIVKRQTPFLDHGISQLAPMTMAEIAAVVGVHETTVSRALSGKFVRTPKGIYEMKFFFTPGIKTEGGVSMSNLAVKDKISNLVAHEDPSSPLSDQELQDKLMADGLKIARRTITKYRLVLHIPPSHLRKV